MPPVQETPQSLRAFIYHGCYVRANGDEAIGDCIFCGKESKFYVNIATTKFQCKVCGKSGNDRDFLQELYEAGQEITTEEQYEELAKERKYLSVEPIAQYLGGVRSVGRDEWILPGYYHGNDRIKNLYRYTDYGSKDSKKRCMSTPGLDLTLYGIQHFNEDKDTIYICEGPWDGAALWETMSLLYLNLETGELEYTGNIDNSLLSHANVVAVPSANSFNEHWAKLLEGKRVFILGHNDHPSVDKKTGKKTLPAAYLGMKRIVGLLRDWDIQPTEVHYLAWGGDGTYDPKLKHGYDVRDLLSEGYIFPTGSNQRISQIEQRSKQLEKLFSLCKPIPANWVDPSNKDKASAGKLTLALMECTSYAELIKEWDKVMIWHRGLDKTFSVMLACITSTMQPGDQLWVRVVSAPSSGKSELCSALTVNRKYVVPKSSFRGFYSGYKQSNEDKKKNSGEKKEDLGLIAEIMNKTFVTKDGDTLLQTADRARILSEARDLYDGNAQTHFKNDTGKEYPIIRTTWILCGTESLRQLDTSELGERFLDCKILDHVPPELEREITNQAIWSMFRGMGKSVDVKKIESVDDADKVRVKKMTGGYIEYLRKNSDKLITAIQNTVTQDVVNKINDLALFISYMRARPSDKQEEKAHKELSARLGKQLARLAMCLAVVMNKPTIDRAIMSRVYDVTMDTANGTTFDMAKHLYRNPKGVGETELKGVMQQKEERINELLRFLRRIRAFEVYTPKVGQNSYGAARYKLSTNLRELCDRVFNS